MAVCKRRSEVKDDHDTSRKPSALFWKEDSMNKPRIGATRKKDNSGGNIKKLQDSAYEGSKENRVPTMNKHQRRPSLKDLCPEDKGRVKQLIEQLARTSTDKEAMEGRMKEERRQFTLLLDKLKKQHHKVVKEKKELETELHASQLQLQAIHTYPPSSTATTNPSSQLTPHQHTGAATTTIVANPLQTPAAPLPPPRGPGVIHLSRSIHTVPPSRNLPPMESRQPPAIRTPLLQQSTVGAHSNALPLPQAYCDSELTSSRVTCAGVPSLCASYPGYFMPSNSSRNSNHSSINFGNHHTQGSGSSTTTSISTAYPSHAMMDSLSTTSISHGQVPGAPLSSTHVQHYTSNYSQQHEYQAGGDRHPYNIKIHNMDLPSVSSDTTATYRSGPSQHGGEGYGHEVHVPTIKHHMSTHSSTHSTYTDPEKQQEQVRASHNIQHELVAPVDQVNTSPITTRPEPTTPVPLAIAPPERQHWLSLPSATPEQRPSPCDKTRRKREAEKEEDKDGGVDGSCREIGTQTMCVESVATQTDLNDGGGGECDHTRPPTCTCPAVTERMSVSSSSPTLTKDSVDSTAMSVGDLHATTPSGGTSQANTKLSVTEYTPGPGQGISDGHRARQDLNSDDISFLLNCQGALDGVGQTGSQEFSSISNEAKFESILDSPFELAASLNSHTDPSSSSPNLSFPFQQHHLPHHHPNPPFSFHQYEYSPPSETRLSTTSPGNTPPRYTNYYRDSTRTRQGWSLDDSKLIEELFFI